MLQAMLQALILLVGTKTCFEKLLSTAVEMSMFLPP
jgi:hypothetical protein